MPSLRDSGLFDWGGSYRQAVPTGLETGGGVAEVRPRWDVGRPHWTEVGGVVAKTVERKFSAPPPGRGGADGVVLDRWARYASHRLQAFDPSGIG